MHLLQSWKLQALPLRILLCGFWIIAINPAFRDNYLLQPTGGSKQAISDFLWDLTLNTWIYCFNFIKSLYCCPFFNFNLASASCPDSTPLWLRSSLSSHRSSHLLMHVIWKYHKWLKIPCRCFKAPLWLQQSLMDWKVLHWGAVPMSSTHTVQDISTRKSNNLCYQ